MVIKNVRYKNNERLKKDIAGLLSENWVGMKSGKDKLSTSDEIEYPSKGRHNNFLVAGG